MNSQVHDQGWISVPIEERFEVHAKGIRAERDKQYGNIYSEAESDERWVGDLGELAFNSWLKHEGVTDFQWLQDATAGKPDFILPGGIRVGIKTVKRKVSPRSNYTAQITARHTAEPIDQFFFMTYQFSERIMWLLGGTTREHFLAGARYYAAGEWVHASYQIREGHEIYNIDILKLTAPSLWLNTLAKQNSDPR